MIDAHSLSSYLPSQHPRTNFAVHFPLPVDLGSATCSGKKRRHRLTSGTYFWASATAPPSCVLAKPSQTEYDSSSRRQAQAMTITRNMTIRRYVITLWPNSSLACLHMQPGDRVYLRRSVSESKLYLHDMMVSTLTVGPATFLASIHAATS